MQYNTTKYDFFDKKMMLARIFVPTVVRSLKATHSPYLDLAPLG
jgi:hypothetical protein